MSSRTILVVDDEPCVLRATADMLRLMGFEVVEAASGEQALAFTRETPFHLILSDIRLPGMDGYRIMRAVRAAHPSVVGIAMTGYMDDLSHEAALAAGYDQVLQKPFNYHVLQSAVTSLLGDPAAAPSAP